jgi:hypothetical protein
MTAPAFWASLLSALEFLSGLAQFSWRFFFVPDKPRDGAASFVPDVADP